MTSKFFILNIFYLSVTYKHYYSFPLDQNIYNFVYYIYTFITFLQVDEIIYFVSGSIDLLLFFL